MIPTAILIACALLHFAGRVLAFVERCHDADLRDYRRKDCADWHGVGETAFHGSTSKSFEVRNNG